MHSNDAPNTANSGANNFQFGRARSLESLPHANTKPDSGSPHRHPNPRRNSKLPTDNKEMNSPYPTQQGFASGVSDSLQPFMGGANVPPSWDMSKPPMVHAPQPAAPMFSQMTPFIPPQFPVPHDSQLHAMFNAQALQQQQKQQPQQQQPLLIPPQPSLGIPVQSTRQGLLEQLKQQELELLKGQTTSPSTVPAPSKPAVASMPLPGATSAPTPTSTTSSLTHHDLIRQHNEEYRMKQAKKAAVQMAQARLGYFAGQDSNNFNFVVPILPSFLIDDTNLAPEAKRLKQEMTHHFQPDTTTTTTSTTAAPSYANYE